MNVNRWGTRDYIKDYQHAARNKKKNKGLDVEFMQCNHPAQSALILFACVLHDDRKQTTILHRYSLRWPVILRELSTVSHSLHSSTFYIIFTFSSSSFSSSSLQWIYCMIEKCTGEKEEIKFLDVSLFCVSFIFPIKIVGQSKRKRK